MIGGTAKLVPKEMQGKSLTASIAKQAAIKANAIQRRNRQEYTSCSGFLRRPQNLKQSPT